VIYGGSLAFWLDSKEDTVLSDMGAREAVKSRDDDAARRV
jgi:hypothetical protein